jgi:hypothetical protein
MTDDDDKPFVWTPMQCECLDCGEPFTISVAEQHWFLDLSRRMELPKRCVPCRQAKRAARVASEQQARGL